MLTKEQWSLFNQGLLAISCITKDDCKAFYNEYQKCHSGSNVLSLYETIDIDWDYFNSDISYGAGAENFLTCGNVNYYKNIGTTIIEYKKGDGIVTEQDKIKFEELKKAAQPLIDFLNKYYNPMTKAIITEGYVEILINDMGIPLEVRD